MLSDVALVDGAGDVVTGARRARRRRHRPLSAGPRTTASRARRRRRPRRRQRRRRHRAARGRDGTAWVGYTDHVDAAVGAAAGAADDPADADRPGRRRRAPASRRPCTSAESHATSADGTPVHLFVLAADRPRRTRPRPTVLYGYGGFNVALTPAYTRAGAGLGRGRRGLGGGEPARRLGERRGVAPRRHARAQAERLRRLRRGRRAPGRGRLDDAGAARHLRRLERRPAGRRHAHPAPRPLPRPSSAARRCWTWSGTSCSAWAAPGTTSTAPPATRPSWAGCSATRRTTHVREGTATRRCCSRRSTVRHPGRPAARPQAVRGAAARHGRGRARSLLRRETDVGHGARSVSRTVGLSADQLAFLGRPAGAAAVIPPQPLVHLALSRLADGVIAHGAQEAVDHGRSFGQFVCRQPRARSSSRPLRILLISCWRWRSGGCCSGP